MWARDLDDEASAEELSQARWRFGFGSEVGNARQRCATETNGWSRLLIFFPLPVRRRSTDGSAVPSKKAEHDDFYRTWNSRCSLIIGGSDGGVSSHKTREVRSST